MITITAEDFKKIKGIDLIEELKSYGVGEESMVEITLNNWTKTVYNHIRSKSRRPMPKDSNLSQLQLETLKEVICDVGIYAMNVGDPISYGNEDEQGRLRSSVPHESTEKLKNCGLIRTTFSGWW